MGIAKEMPTGMWFVVHEDGEGWDVSMPKTCREMAVASIERMRKSGQAPGVIKVAFIPFQSIEDFNG